MRERLQIAFDSWGWLLVTWLPLAQVLGRAPGNLLAAGYLLWAALALIGRPLPRPRWLLGLYALMLLAFLLGVPAAQDLGRAVDAWVNFAGHTLALVITLSVLLRREGGVETLLRSLARCALAVVAALYLKLLVLMLAPGELEPTLQLQEDNLPLLLPFLLYWAAGLPAHWRRAAAVGLTGIALAYVLLAQGRAALLGTLAAVLVYGVLGAQWPVRLAAAVVAGLLLLAVVAGGSYMLRGAELGAPGGELVARISSDRTILWRQAIEHPPARPWVGVGMGNVRYSEAVILPDKTLRHLHNFVLDAWYETGWLGLAALLAFLGGAAYAGLRGMARLDPQSRRQSGAFAASAAAILTAALLSYSYGSLPFSIYLMLVIAAMVRLRESG